MAFLQDAQYASLFKPFGSTGGGTGGLTSRIQTEKVVVPVIVMPVTSAIITSQRIRDRANVRLAATLVTFEMADRSTMNVSIVLSFLIALFPEFFNIFNDVNLNTQLVRVDVSDANITTIIGAAAGAKDGLDLSGGDLTEVFCTKYEEDMYVSWEIYAMAGCILFSLGANVNQSNFVKITENRPRAVAGYAKATPTPAGFLTAQKMPNLDWVLAFQGAFEQVPKIKEVVVREIMSWVLNWNGVGDKQRLIAVNCKLWMNFGFSHVGLITNLIAAYRNEIGEIGDLMVEATRFVAERESIATRKPVELLYEKLVNSQSGTMLAKNYPNLFCLAVNLQKRVDPKLANYATTVGTSPYEEIFIEVLTRNGKRLPTAVAARGAGI